MRTITTDDLNTAVDRIERKIDHRFDHFEKHFDETMTAVRATLDELATPQREGLRPGVPGTAESREAARASTSKEMSAGLRFLPQARTDLIWDHIAQHNVARATRCPKPCQSLAEIERYVILQT